MELSLTTSALGESTIVEVDGVVDLSTSPSLRARLIDAIQAGCRELVVDCTGVGFVDSSGLGVLIGARRRQRANGGEFTLIVPPGVVRDLFTITGLDSIFAFRDVSPARARH